MVKLAESEGVDACTAVACIGKAGLMKLWCITPRFLCTRCRFHGFHFDFLRLCSTSVDMFSTCSVSRYCDNATTSLWTNNAFFLCCDHDLQWLRKHQTV